MRRWWFCLALVWLPPSAEGRPPQPGTPAAAPTDRDDVTDPRSRRDEEDRDPRATKDLGTSIWERAIRVLAITLVLVGLLTLLYHAMPPRRLPPKKPRFAVFPAYRFQVPLSPAVLGAPDPVEELTRRLAARGFDPTWISARSATYSRGSIWRESIKKGLLRLTFTLPLEPSTSAVAKGGWIIAFDTGDLWRFCSGVQTSLALDRDERKDGEEPVRGGEGTRA